MTLMPGVAAGAVASGASDIFALGAATGEGLSDGAAIVVCGGSATDEAGALRHYKVQDPSLLNWFGLALAVRNNEISDFPICNKSFDLSYAGNDL